MKKNIKIMTLEEIDNEIATISDQISDLETNIRMEANDMYDKAVYSEITDRGQFADEIESIIDMYESIAKLNAEKEKLERRPEYKLYYKKTKAG